MGILDDVMDSISGGKNGQATDALNRARGEYANIVTPSVESQQLYLEELQKQGLLTPEMEQAILQGDSSFSNISTDPRLKQAQLSALSQLQEIGDSGGMNLQDKANLENLKSSLAQSERGSREAITQNMAQRGMAGSGMELASQLMNQQSSAQKASQQGLDIAAQAQQRALEAIMNAGTLGGNMRSQDYNEQAQAAAAQDAINKFNTANQQQVQTNNVQARNNAQASNLASSQEIANANVATRNQQQQYNKELLQKQFDNQIAKANGVAGVDKAQADLYTQQGNANKQFLGSLIGAGASAYAGSKK